jgi:glycosyltransferase involved in cell wall biosynthesis
MDKIASINIVIPCYNVEEVIEKCLRSLSSQVYPKNKYHCYFVNDASTDNTAEILNSFNSYEQITVIHHERNLGLSSARNTGINKCNADFIAFLDGDMVVENDWIESFLPYFSKNTIAVMGDNIPPTDLKLNPVEKYYFGNIRGARQFNDGDNISLQYMLYNNAMVKRPALLKSGLFDENITKYGGEDTDLSAKIWNMFPHCFIYSKKSNSVHYHRRSLSQFCSSMNTYGRYNLPILIDRYPQHKTKFGADWIFTLKGYLLFNALSRAFIRTLSKIYPAQLVIRYLVVDSVIKGARKTRKSN